MKIPAKINENKAQLVPSQAYERGWNEYIHSTYDFMPLLPSRSLLLRKEERTRFATFLIPAPENELYHSSLRGVTPLSPSHTNVEPTRVAKKSALRGEFGDLRRNAHEMFGNGA